MVALSVLADELQEVQKEEAVTQVRQGKEHGLQTAVTLLSKRPVVQGQMVEVRVLFCLQVAQDDPLVQVLHE